MNPPFAKLRFIVPNVATALNLFLGFFSITEAFHGNYSSAASCVLAGIIIDLCDGALARGFSATSNFGKEFDSLADLAVFGIAPAVLLYQHYFSSFGFWRIILSFLPMLCAALRLARFNLQTVNTYFIGLPSPAAAGLIIGAALFSDSVLGQTPTAFRLLASVTLCASMLMTSSIRFPHLRKVLPVSLPQLLRDPRRGQ